VVKNSTKRRRTLNKIRERLKLQEASKTQRLIAIVLTIIFVGYFFIFWLINEYIQKRYLTQSNPEAIMYVSSCVDLASIPAGFLGASISFAYLTYYRYQKFHLRKSWKGLCIFLIISSFCAVTPLIFIKNRYDIMQDGIYKYSSLGLLQRRYSWSDILEATVKISPPGYRTYYNFNYTVILNNEKKLWLNQDGHAKDFWNSLYSIDGILRKNNVRIYRYNRYLDKFNKDYSDKIIQLLK
jgi:hypothetical protein